MICFEDMLLPVRRNEIQIELYIVREFVRKIFSSFEMYRFSIKTRTIKYIETYQRHYR